MNQALKDAVYGKGNSEELSFLARCGGMNAEETEVLKLIHDGNSDLNIQEQMHLSRRAYERVENSVRSKLCIAVFHCITKAMDKQ